MPEKITKIKGIICRNKMTTEQCPVCGGMGMNKNEAESTDTLTVHDIEDCPNCNGTGRVEKEVTQSMRCDRCHYKAINKGRHGWCYMFEKCMPHCSHFQHAR